ncbi:MAG: YjgN family protein [Sphingorhabdus sp.]|uniref:YjgN family protein n=1 Tax=Sphingorhabdus sp. TaxID=1902408 RepID=UPI0038FCD17F
MSEDLTQRHSAFRFHGSWQEFAKIAFPNLLLTIVTLGIYRFWATTREREYLWAQTDFIDERLEWTGKGLELFIGFIMVFLLLGLPIIVMQLVSQGLIFRGQTFIAGVVTIAMFVMLFYLSGVAYFRALRYRLSRTYWRGIRGGSNDPGFGYGISYMWKNIVGVLPIFLLVPWSMISLWNERWNSMSFGPHSFESNARWQPLMKRYLLFYLVPFLMFVGGIILGIAAATSGGQLGGLGGTGMAIGSVLVVVAILSLYIILPLAALAYYSKYFRIAVGGLRLHNLEFDFRARAPDWILFFLANMVIVICTLGIGYIFMPYRNWKFFIDHMEAYGEINIDELTQSKTIVSKHGEGLLDAFDVGAI